MTIAWQGLDVFHQRLVPSYSTFKTLQLARNNKVTIPQNGFHDFLEIALGKTKVEVAFLGEGHTRDNCIGYFADENVMFGGCLIKSMDADKGYLGDANTQAWPETVKKLKEKYPEVAIVIPGHGKPGGQELFDYTIQLFTK